MAKIKAVGTPGPGFHFPHFWFVSSVGFLNSCFSSLFLFLQPPILSTVQNSGVDHLSD